MTTRREQRPLVIRRYGDVDLAAGMCVKEGVYGHIEVRASWRGRRRFKRFPMTSSLSERLMWQHQTVEAMRLGRAGFETTLAEDIDAYVAALDEDRAKRSRQWLQFWRDWYGHLTRHELTLQHAQAFFSGIRTRSGGQLSASSKNKLRTYLLNVYRYHDGRAHTCPCLDIPQFREPRAETREMRPEDVKALLAQMDDTPNRARLQILWYTGCRPAELFWLREDAFHLEGAHPFVVIRSAKRGATRTVWLPPEAVDAARAFLRHRGWQAAPNLYRDMQRAAVRAGLTVDRGERYPGGRRKVLISPYCLRHSYAMQLRRSGADIDDIANALGHKNLNTTRRYAQAIPERQAAVIGKMWEKIGVGA